MKKYIAFLACFLASMSANAEFITLPDGVTESSDLLVEIGGTPVGSGVSVDDTVSAFVQFQLNALDPLTDELNGDDRLTVQFVYYTFDPVNPAFIAWDTDGYSITWTDVATLQATASDSFELTFTSLFKDWVSGPYETDNSLDDGEADYLVAALVESSFYVGGTFWGIDLEVPPPPPAPPGDAVSAPATFGMFAIALAGLALRRRSK